MGFEIGDLVELKSGGPTMVVEDLGMLDNSPITCVWFDGNKREAGQFKREILVPSKQGKATKRK
jgi:uncharacterized protein YodC (DUF2158 family)